MDWIQAAVMAICFAHFTLTRRYRNIFFRRYHNAWKVDDTHHYPHPPCVTWQLLTDTPEKLMMSITTAPTPMREKWHGYYSRIHPCINLVNLGSERFRVQIQLLLFPCGSSSVGHSSLNSVLSIRMISDDSLLTMVFCCLSYRTGTVILPAYSV